MQSFLDSSDAVAFVAGARFEYGNHKVSGHNKGNTAFMFKPLKIIQFFSPFFAKFLEHGQFFRSRICLFVFESALQHQIISP